MYVCVCVCVCVCVYVRIYSTQDAIPVPISIFVLFFFLQLRQYAPHIHHLLVLISETYICMEEAVQLYTLFSHILTFSDVLVISNI